MPPRIPSPCTKGGCNKLTIKGRCPDHLIQRRRASDKQRGTSHQRGYTARWRKARLLYLGYYPLCVRCKARNRVTSATVVDHIKPHKGDQKLFWDADNWQSLCAPCHNSKTASEDGGGW